MAPETFGVLFFLAFVVVCLVVVVRTLRNLQRRNQVAPPIPTTAPLTWLQSPSKGARLHRRLRDATSSARASVDAAQLTEGLGTLVVELERYAVGVDRQLVVVDRASTPVRRRQLRELHAEVQMVEGVSERIIRTTRSYSGAQPSQHSIAAINERLDALDAAMADLARIERLGVGDAARVMQDRKRQHPR